MKNVAQHLTRELRKPVPIFQVNKIGKRRETFVNVDLVEMALCYYIGRIVYMLK